LINTERIIINLVPGSKIGGIMPEVTASQYDVGRTIELELYNGDVPATLPTGTTAQFECTKPDGHGVSVAASLSNNIVTVNLIQQMTIVAGRVDCKINLINGANRVGTALFAMDVEKAGVNDSTDLSGSVLPDLIALASEQEAHAAASAAGAAASAASAAASAASAASAISAGVQQANNAANQAERAATRSETAATEAEIAARTAADEAVERTLNAISDRVRQAKSWAVYSSDPDAWGNDYNNAEYWCDMSHHYADRTQRMAEQITEKMDILKILINMIIGDIDLLTQDGSQLLTQSGDNLILSWLEQVFILSQDGRNILTQSGVEFMAQQ
jgi:hypothetical protein